MASLFSAHALVKFTVFHALLSIAFAHMSGWHNGMFCLNGTSGIDNQDTSEASEPLFNLAKKDWWFHHYNGCDQYPPAPGAFLELPALGSVTLEISQMRTFTSLSFGGTRAGKYIHNKDLPGIASSNKNHCITDPNIHTQNETMAAGTALLISYNSNLADVTVDNLVVFSVLAHSPWLREAVYQIPELPPCPPGGCICAWSWIANGCGTPNMFMTGYKCKVTGAAGKRPLATPRPPKWCEDDKTKCVAGAKQIIVWNQASGNTVSVSGYDLSGNPRRPGYNMKMGFSPGPQTDIFQSGTNTKTTSSKRSSKKTRST